MKKFGDRCGATLLEVMISIAMLGLLMVPISSGILMSLRMNERSDEIMQARLAVSSAVETIMAVGVDNYTAFEGLTVTTYEEIADSNNTVICYRVNVSHNVYEDVYVTTYIRGDAVRTDYIGGGT